MQSAEVAGIFGEQALGRRQPAHPDSCDRHERSEYGRRALVRVLRIVAVNVTAIGTLSAAPLPIGTAAATDAPGRSPGKRILARAG